MKCKKKAFTLIELLVVITIIALLMSVIVPALSKAKYTARRLLCTSNLHQWGLAVSAYANDQDGHLPRQDIPAGGKNTCDVAMSFIRCDDNGDYGRYQDTTTGQWQDCVMVRYGITDNKFIYCPLTSKKVYQALKDFVNLWPAYSIWMGYSWWVPRGCGTIGQITEDDLFPYSVDSSGRRTIDFPQKVSDKVATTKPILTDTLYRTYSFTANDLSDSPTVSEDWRAVINGTILSDEVWGYHARNNRIVDINLLYADTHVDTKKNTGERASDSMKGPAIQVRYRAYYNNMY